jgi:hypothetical protein
MIGRPRKHESNAARQREYRLRKKQLRMLLTIPNPERDSLAWRVQYADAVRRLDGEPWLDKFRRDCREAAEAGVREAQASLKEGDGNGKDD